LDEESLVRNIIEDAINPIPTAPSMPKNVNPFAMINVILDLENKMRHGLDYSSLEKEVAEKITSQYWKNLFFVLATSGSIASETGIMNYEHCKL
jgi:hypothetical protein